MTIIKIILLLPLFIFFIFILWMNLTPGHYQFGNCGCNANYLTESEVQSLDKNCPFIGQCPPRIHEEPKNKILIFLSNFDLYK